MIYAPIPDAPIEAAFAPQLFEVRGVSVIIDADLARLFGVETKRLNQQTRRRSSTAWPFSLPSRSSRL